MIVRNQNIQRKLQFRGHPADPKQFKIARDRIEIIYREKKLSSLSKRREVSDGR